MLIAKSLSPLTTWSVITRTGLGSAGAGVFFTCMGYLLALIFLSATMLRPWHVLFSAWAVMLCTTAASGYGVFGSVRVSLETVWARLFFGIYRGLYGGAGIVFLLLGFVTVIAPPALGDVVVLEKRYFAISTSGLLYYVYTLACVAVAFVIGAIVWSVPWPSNNPGSAPAQGGE